jgi:hypothetical protein
MPDREYGGGSYNSGYGSGGSSNPRAGDTPGFGTGGGGSVGGGGGYGVSGGGLAGGGDRGGRDASDMAAQQAVANAARIAAERAAYEQQQAQAAQQAAAQRAAAQAAQQAAVQAALARQQQEEAARANAARIAAERAAYQRQQQGLLSLMQSKATGPTTRGGPASVAAQQAARNQLILNTTGKIIDIESGGDPRAKAKTSSATGLGQFTQGTWMKMIETYRPELLEGRNRQQVLELRTDPELSIEMTGNLARENANYLESRGVPVNENSLYLSHFLGAGDAAKVLKAAPDTPISELVKETSIAANQNILGGDKTASDITRWASNKMLASAPARGAVTASGAEPLPGPLDAYQPTSGFAAPSGGEQVAKPAQQAGLLDQIFGGPDAMQNRISALEAEGRYAGLDKQTYATQFAGGDVSKVRSRITDFGQGPVVDYYVKDLSDVAGEAIGGLFGGIGNLFKGGEKPMRGPNEAYGAPVATGSIFGNLFSGTPRSDYGPYGDLTAEQYRQQYGGRDISQPQTVAAVAPPAATPSSAALAQIPTPEELARSPYLWQQYYNRIPQNYGIQMAQAPLVGPAIRGIFS